MNWKEFIAATIWLFGITLSIIAIFAILGDIKLSVGVLSLTLGILAIIWVSIARKSLSPGSSLRTYTTYFLLSLIFVMLFSLWNIADEIFHFKSFLSYVGYIFIAASYTIFLRAAYQILSIGKEFGFQTQAMRIKSAMEERKETSQKPVQQPPQKPAQKPIQNITHSEKNSNINKQLDSALKARKSKKAR